jgi:predicted DCC family thiol-disulfide oxidoreductase YuxK
MDTSSKILIFDGACNLCNGLVRFIIRKDSASRIRFATLKSDVGKSLLRRFCLSTNDTNSVVYISGEMHYLKSAAILHLLNDLGRAWRLFYFFIIIPESIRDFFYNLIAKNRYRIFGKTETCMVHGPDLNVRFLS